MNTDPIALTMGQTFEIERFNRAIDATESVDKLRDLAKQLLSAWMNQKAATNWAIRQQMSPMIGRELLIELQESEKSTGSSP